MNTSAIYTAMVNVIYPVGSIIQNYNDPTSPEDRFPGTKWERLENVFLVNQGSYLNRTFEGGSVDKLSTGGSERVSLEPKHLPAHKHKIGYFNGEVGGADPGGIESQKHIQVVFEEASPTNCTGLAKIGPYETSKTGNNNYSHENMPPYTRVYGWYRKS